MTTDRRIEAESILNQVRQAYENQELQRAERLLEKVCQIHHELNDHQSERDRRYELRDVVNRIRDEQFEHKTDQYFAYHDKSIALSQQLGERAEEACGRCKKGKDLKTLGRLPEAVDSFEQGLHVALDVKELWKQRCILPELAFSCIRLGEFDKAESYYNQYLAVIDTLSEKSYLSNAEYERGVALLGLASVFTLSGETLKALEAVQEGIKKGQESSKLKGYGLMNLGIIFGEMGELERSLQFCREAVETSKASGDPEVEGYALAALGKAHYRMGELKLAIAAYQNSLEIAVRRGDCYEQGRIQEYLGEAYLALAELTDNFTNAILCSQKALDIARETNNLYRESCTLLSIGDIYSALEEYEKATDCYEQSLEIEHRHGNRLSQMKRLEKLSRVSVLMRQNHEAIEFANQWILASQLAGDVQAEADALLVLEAAFENYCAA